MLNEQINNVMKSALKSASKNTGIDIRDVRIQMRLTEDLQSAECKIFNKNECYSDLRWGKMLGLAFVAFQGMVVSKITEGLYNQSNERQIEPKNVNAMFQAVSPNIDFEICVCDGEKRKKIVQIQELINANS